MHVDRVLTQPQTPGLSSGTSWWPGGWARTGEHGKRELAILPGGQGAQGNVTFLPRGASVLPNELTERIFSSRPVPGLARGVFSVSSLPDSFADRLALALSRDSRADLTSRVSSVDRPQAERSRRGGVHIHRFEAHYQRWEDEDSFATTVWKLKQLYGDA